MKNIYFINYNDINDFDYCIKILSRKDKLIQSLDSKIVELRSKLVGERVVKEYYENILNNLEDILRNCPKKDIISSFKKVLGSDRD